MTSNTVCPVVANPSPLLLQGGVATEKTLRLVSGLGVFLTLAFLVDTEKAALYLAKAQLFDSSEEGTAAATKGGGEDGEEGEEPETDQPAAAAAAAAAAAGAKAQQQQGSIAELLPAVRRSRSGLVLSASPAKANKSAPWTPEEAVSDAKTVQQNEDAVRGWGQRGAGPLAQDPETKQFGGACGLLRLAGPQCPAVIKSLVDWAARRVMGIRGHLRSELRDCPKRVLQVRQPLFLPHSLSFSLFLPLFSLFARALSLSLR